jgi:predicted nucleotidyltransferase
MESESNIGGMEFGRDKNFEIPPVESFFPDKAEEFWPEEIVENESFRQQIEEHQERSDNIRSTLDKIPEPTTTIEKAIKDGSISADQAEKLYNSVSELLEDADYQRLLLYLPFEMVPDKEWAPEGKLGEAVNKFKACYMASWENLLQVQDVRANFVDGDVLEIEQRERDLPRVVKAAHLTPILVEKGLVELEDIVSRKENTTDPVLRESFDDALAILAEKEEVGHKLREVNFTTIREELYVRIGQIRSEDYHDITEKRKAWLQEEKTREVIEELAEDLSKRIAEMHLAEGELESFTVSEDRDIRQVFIEGVRKAVEKSNLDQGKSIYERYDRILSKLWDNPENKDILSKAYRRFNQLGLIGDHKLGELTISVPNIAGPFSENTRFLGEEIKVIKKSAEITKLDPELNDKIYPVALVYGSSLKGYGESEADIDLAVFIKPGTPFSEKESLKELLRKNFAQGRVTGDILQFWLKEEEGGLSIQNFDDPDVVLGESFAAHILFGGAWEGDKKAIGKLREQLLSRYLFESDEKVFGRKERSLCLEELERDALQYRLMHKGYERFFPPAGGFYPKRADRVDGESVFWDSGYRRLATKLYVDRVFLPKI